MALDVSLRAIGVAISDETQMLATPLATLTRQPRGHRRDVATICRMVRETGVTGVVVGLPLTLEGEWGTSACLVQEFVEALRKRLGVPVVLHDERLSTFEATERLKEAGRRPQESRTGLDAAAAACILQDYLDRRRQGRL